MEIVFAEQKGALTCPRRVALHFGPVLAHAVEKRHCFCVLRPFLILVQLLGTTLLVQLLGTTLLVWCLNFLVTDTGSRGRITYELERLVASHLRLRLFFFISMTAAHHLPS